MIEAALGHELVDQSHDPVQEGVVGLADCLRMGKPVVHGLVQRPGIAHVGQPAHEAAQWVGTGLLLVENADLATEQAVHDGGEDVVLGVEVPIDVAPGHAGGGTDVRHRGLGVALREKELGGRG